GSSSGTAAPALFNYQTRLDDGTPDGQLVNFSAEAYAHAETSISANSLHALVQVYGSASPISYTYTDVNDNSTHITYNTAGSKAVAFVNLNMGDFITVSSLTRPLGANAQIRFSGTLHSSVLDTEAAALLAGDGSGPSLAQAQFGAGAPTDGAQFFLTDGDGVVTPHLANRTVSAILNVHIGEVVQINPHLLARATGVAS